MSQKKTNAIVVTESARLCKTCQLMLPIERFPLGHRRYACRMCYYATQRLNGNTAHAAMITSARLLSKRLFSGYDTLFSVAGLRCAGLIDHSFRFQRDRHIVPRDPCLPISIPDNMLFCNSEQREALLAVWRTSAESRTLYMQLLERFATFTTAEPLELAVDVIQQHHLLTQKQQRAAHTAMRA
jgi:hypothetical protein